MTPDLFRVIGTPNCSLIEKLKKADLMPIGGHWIKAICIAEPHQKQGGGFNAGVYLYQRENGAYRVLKILAESQKELHGGIARKIETFNQMYQSIYEGELSQLATADYFYNSSNIIDMPYIHGEDVVLGEDFNIVTDGEQRKLYEFFDAYGFFITDYRIPGNIVRVNDQQSRKSYFLIRDVDLLGRRNSMTVTLQLLESEFLDSYKQAHNFQDKEEYEKLKAISEGKSLLELCDRSSSNGLEEEFIALKEALLTTMYAKKMRHEEYERIASTTNFPHLCDIMCQHRSKPGFFRSKMTSMMVLLHDEFKKDNYHQLKSFYKLQDNKLNLQLRSIGATSKNFIENTFAQDKAKLANANRFFKKLYYPEFTSQSRQALKDTLLANKREIFHTRDYIEEIKSKLK